MNLLVNAGGVMCPQCLESNLRLTMDVSATFRLTSARSGDNPWRLYAISAGHEIWPANDTVEALHAVVLCMTEEADGTVCGWETSLTEEQYEDIYASLEQQ